LLAHGDAPSLEFEAEFARGTMLLARRRWSEAIARLRAAREAAHAERAGERELLATALEVFGELAASDVKDAYESASVLVDARLVAASARVAAIAWVARGLVSLSASDREGAEDALAAAEARVRGGDRANADAYVLVEVVGMLLDAARGALPDFAASASRLETFAETHAFEGFHWIDVLGAIVDRLPDDVSPAKMRDALARLAPILGSESRLARERRTDAPPASH
jgi:hypothetical protein